MQDGGRMGAGQDGPGARPLPAVPAFARGIPYLPPPPPPARSPRAVALRCRRLTVRCPGSALGCGLHRGVSAWPGPALCGSDAAAAVRSLRFGFRFGAVPPGAVR